MTTFKIVPFTEKQIRIIQKYEELRGQSGKQPIKRLVAIELNYTVDPKSNFNSYVNDVINKWSDKRKELLEQHKAVLELRA